MAFIAVEEDEDDSYTFDTFLFTKHNPEIFVAEDGVVDLLSPSQRNLIDNYNTPYLTVEGYHLCINWAVFRHSDGQLTLEWLSSAIKEWFRIACDHFHPGFFVFKYKYWSVKGGVIRVFDFFLQEELPVLVKSKGYCYQLFLSADKCHLMGIEDDRQGSLVMVEYHYSFVAPPARQKLWLKDWDDKHTCRNQRYAYCLDCNDNNRRIEVHRNKIEGFGHLIKYIKKAEIHLQSRFVCNVDPLISKHLHPKQPQHQFDVIALTKQTKQMFVFLFSTHSLLFNHNTKEWRVIPQLSSPKIETCHLRITTFGNKTLVDGKLYVVKKWYRHKLVLDMYEFDDENSVKISTWLYCPTLTKFPEILGLYTEYKENGTEVLTVNYRNCYDDHDQSPRIFLDEVEERKLSKIKSKYLLDTDAVLLTKDILTYNNDDDNEKMEAIVLKSVCDGQTTNVSIDVAFKKLSSEYFEKLLSYRNDDPDKMTVYKWTFKTSTLRRILQYVNTGVLSVPTFEDVSEVIFALDYCLFFHIRDQCIHFVMERNDIWNQNFFDLFKMVDLPSLNPGFGLQLVMSLYRHPEFFEGVKLPIFPSYKNVTCSNSSNQQQRDRDNFILFRNLYWFIENWNIIALDTITNAKLPPIQMMMMKKLKVMKIFLSADERSLMGLEYDDDDGYFKVVKYCYQTEMMPTAKTTITPFKNFHEVVDGHFKHLNICLKKNIIIRDFAIHNGYSIWEEREKMKWEQCTVRSIQDSTFLISFRFGNHLMLDNTLYLKIISYTKVDDKIIFMTK